MVSTFSCDITPPFLSVPVQRPATFSTPPGASDGPPPQSSNSGPYCVEHHPLELPGLDPVRNRPECCVAQPPQNRVLELAYAPLRAGTGDDPGHTLPAQVLVPPERRRHPILSYLSHTPGQHHG